jgi:hypothetical protein
MSEVFAQLKASYLQENLAFAVVHGALLLWATWVAVRAVWTTWRDQAWLRRPGRDGTGRLPTLWKQLRDTRNAARAARALRGEDERRQR